MSLYNDFHVVGIYRGTRFISVFILRIKEEHIVILRTLYFDKIINEKHTSIVHLKKVHSRFQKTIGKAIEDLRKNGYLVIKKAGYGDQVSLNIHMLPEIEQVLGIEP